MRSYSAMPMTLKLATRLAMMASLSSASSVVLVDSLERCVELDGLPSVVFKTCTKICHSALNGRTFEVSVRYVRSSL